MLYDRELLIDAPKAFAGSSVNSSLYIPVHAAKTTLTAYSDRCHDH